MSESVEEPRLPPAFIEGGGEQALLTLPEHLRSGIRLYVMNGIRPGAFLRAVIDHDWGDVIDRAAPGITLQDIKNIKAWFYTYAPKAAHGPGGKRFKWEEDQQHYSAERTIRTLQRMGDPKF